MFCGDFHQDGVGAFKVDQQVIWDKYLTIPQDQYRALLYNKKNAKLWEMYRNPNRYNVIGISSDQDIYDLASDEAAVSVIGIKDKIVRVYPGSNCCAHVLGFVNKLDEGGAGIELKYNSYLLGVDGCNEGIQDARRRKIDHFPSVHVEPVPGADIYLTLDLPIQKITERVLRQKAV